MSAPTQPSTEDLIAAALAYAARGWPVFPCSPKTKAPLLPPDKDTDGKPIPLTGGLKKGSTDQALIRGWWKKWPRALIGLATGHERLFVLDFDPRTDRATGETWTLARLKGELETEGWTHKKHGRFDGIGALPETLTSITPSGGVHAWFTWPDDGGPEIRNKGSLPEHVDVRGAGGYIIAPPGFMPDYKGQGPRDYRILRDRDIAEAPAALVAILRGEIDGQRPEPAPAPAPERLRRGAGGAAATSDGDPVESARRKFALAAFDEVVRATEALREGSRNRGMYDAAFRLGRFVGAGYLGEAMVRAELGRIAALWPDVAKTQGTIESGLSGGMALPMDMSEVGALAGRRGSPARGSGAPRPFAPPSGPGDGLPPTPEGFDPSFQTEGGEPYPGGGVGGAASGGDGAQKPPSDRVKVEPDPERDRRCATLPQTDLGNAERFALRHGRDFRFCPELGWFHWDGRRWRLLSEEKDKLPGEVMQAVFATVRAIGHEADAVAQSGLAQLPIDHISRVRLKKRLVADGILEEEDKLESILGDLVNDATGEIAPGLDFAIKVKATGEVLLFSDTIRAHARASEGKGRLEAIAGLAKSFPGLLIKAEQLDADGMAINVMNGTIRIATRNSLPVIVLQPHARGDLITKMADVIYNPAATCPKYDGFFARVMPDEDDRRFLHQWAGLSSTGDISHHKMVYFWGKGRNGKSTWVDTIAAILGDYALTINSDSFLEQANKRKGSDATPDLARLPGIRFLRASEPDKGATLAEGLIKGVTGGEPISVRHLNKGFFDFLPSFKFTWQANYMVRIKGTDDGIWARVRFVPWTVRIPDSEIDRTLPETLRKERSGIFNRMMAGLIDMMIYGLIESDNVRAATAKYREASDALGRFLRDCTEDRPGTDTRSGELFDLFREWCRATGAGEWQPQGFAKAMEDRGYERKTSNGVWWRDLHATVEKADITQGNFGGAAGQGGAGRGDEDD